MHGDRHSRCGLQSRDLTPGDYDAPPFSLGGQDDYAFSPDGQEICYSSNHDPVEAISTNKDLFTVPVNFPADASSAQVLAATKNITANNKAADETPLYSPDGKYIAYRAQARPGYESDRWRLMLYDRKTGESRNLPEDLDRWLGAAIGSFVWSGDPGRLYFIAERRGQSCINSIPTAANAHDFAFFTDRQGDVRMWPSNDMPCVSYDDDLSISPDGKMLLFTRMSMPTRTKSTPRLPA